MRSAAEGNEGVRRVLTDELVTRETDGRDGRGHREPLVRTAQYAL